jgi:cell division protease FtsH
MKYINFFIVINFILNSTLTKDKNFNFNDNNESGIFKSTISFLKNITKKIFNFEDYQKFEDPKSYKYQTFDSIIGFNEEKEEIMSFFKDMKNKRSKKRMFFFIGPEGMGKRKFIYSIANTTKLPILHLNIADILFLDSNFQVDLKKTLMPILKFAQKNSPCIFYIENASNKEIGFSLEDQKEIFKLINYFSKKNTGITFIFSSTSHYEVNDLIELNPSFNKIFFIDKISEKDRIDIINFFLEEYKIIINNEDFLKRLYNFFEKMTILEIKNNIIILRDIIFQKETTIINKEIIIIAEDIKELEDHIKKLEKKNKYISSNMFHDAEFITDKTLDDIAGYPEIKEKLLKLIPNMQKKEKQQKGILFIGPPGVGKTQIIRALAGSAKIRLISVDPIKLLSQDGDKMNFNINSVFTYAKYNSPCILFIDEIDILLENKLANSSFLINLDGVHELNGVTVIGSTNYPCKIDDRIRRSGRMSLEVKISQPKEDDRKEIINLYLKKAQIKTESNCVFDQLVERTRGMSGAFIKEYINNIADYVETNKIESINSQILFNVFIETVLGSKSNILIEKKELIQIAYHEASHGILQYVLYRQNQSLFDFSFLTIEPRSGFLGISVGIETEDYRAATKEKLEGQLKITLAGKASQEVFLNTSDTGAYSDLNYATEIAYRYISKWGLLKKRLSAIHINKSYIDETSTEIINDVESLLQKEYKIVKKFLILHKPLIDSIVEELLKKKLLSKKEIDKIVENYEKTNKILTI